MQYELMRGSRGSRELKRSHEMGVKLSCFVFVAALFLREIIFVGLYTQRTFLWGKVSKDWICENKTAFCLSSKFML